MWLYYLLKTISTLVSWLPYKLVVNIGIGIGHLYHTIAKKQRIRAEETIKERLGYSDEEAKCTIKSLFVKLGITFMEIMYMPALNKDNIRGLVTFDRPDVLWEALNEGHGVVMLACHMDNWEWLGAALSLYGFPISGTSEILGCARAMKKGRMLGLIADQDGGYDGIFVPFFGKMAATPSGPAYFSRKFKAPIIPIFIVRKEGYYGHQAIVKDPIYYEDTGDRQLDDYRVTLKMTRIVEEVIREYPDNWLWFQHRWNTPYTPTGKEQEHVEK